MPGVIDERCLRQIQRGDNGAAVDIVGLTTSEKTWHKLSLSWGVTPQMCENYPSTDVLFYNAQKLTKHILNLCDGDKIVITGGVTNGKSGNTNLIMVERV